MAAAPVISDFVVGPDGTEEAVSLRLNDVAVAARVLQMSRNTQVTVPHATWQGKKYHRCTQLVA